MNTFCRAVVLAALWSVANQVLLAQTKNISDKTRGQAEVPAWEEASTTSVRTYVLRLKPGQDLRAELERFAKAKAIQAGYIITCVGSLRKASLRLADKSDSTNYAGKFEIVSLVGTLSPDGPHLHISISDGDGKTLGGHLVTGCEIYTTAEIVIGDAIGLRMTREPDAQSGYQELKVYKISRKQH
ncbi:MAG: DNA-binding protein [Acidobacteria bacterium]|nr:DNA-binding protein [Acidobacteriota bacterium]